MVGNIYVLVPQLKQIEMSWQSLKSNNKHVDERMYEKDLENNEYDYNNNTNEEILPSIALPKSNYFKSLERF